MKYGEVIGVGNTAIVYEWEEGKVLKLFYQGYPKEAVEREFHNAMTIRNMDFAKAKAYDIIYYEERIGIIYDKLEGESLLDWVMKTGNVQECAISMAKLHKVITQNKITNVPNYKEFLKRNIENAPCENPKKREELLQLLDKLPDGNTLCHGDFHPGNILISNGHTKVIDLRIEGLNALLKDIFIRKFIKLHIIVGNKFIADYIQVKFGLAYKSGTVKYFTNTPIKLIDKHVKEMHEEDEYLIRKLSKNVWGPYKVFIENEYKFYGLIEDDKLLSMCGVTQLTAFKSEIIGVETFDENNYMNGFAKATCGFALNETLNLMDIVTWSTNLENISSCKTAESLGFKKYYTLYEFNYG